MAKKNTTVKTTNKKMEAAKNKKTKTMEQIERLENALKEKEQENVLDFVPEEIKADIEADMKEVEKFENPENVDFDKEVKEIFKTAEPSAEVKEQITEFEQGKEKFNEKINKEPENAEKIIQDEIKRVEVLKKKAEAIRAAIEKENKKVFKNSDFTNWWNGTSNLF